MKGKVMRPATESEMADVVRGPGPFVLRGGGTRAIGAAQGAVVETSGLSGVTLYEPGALTLVAWAGTPLDEIGMALAAEGQRLAFEVPHMGAVLGRDGASTIGGVVAANASGPRRVQVGACRDALLGVRFVSGHGEVIKNGGRVMKNVTGYDLTKLIAGSHGTLGVITEVSFKVQAIPEAEATLLGEGMGIQAAVVALAQALGSPYDPSGAGFTDRAAMIRLEGMAGSVAYRAAALRKLLGGDWRLVEGAKSAALWADLRDLRAFVGKPGAIWRISVKPSDGPRVVQALDGETLMDWGGGLVWALMPDGQDVRAALVGINGHATLIRGAGFAAFAPEAPEIATLCRALRHEFDPRGVFNQGMMG